MDNGFYYDIHFNNKNIFLTYLGFTHSFRYEYDEYLVFIVHVVASWG